MRDLQDVDAHAHVHLLPSDEVMWMPRLCLAAGRGEAAEVERLLQDSF